MHAYECTEGEKAPLAEKVNRTFARKTSPIERMEAPWRGRQEVETPPSLCGSMERRICKSCPCIGYLAA